MTSPLSCEISDGIATLRMDDGKANVWGFAMQEAMNAALDRAEAEKAVVVLAGRAGMFSGGFDLAVFKAGGPDVTRMIQGGGAILERLIRHPRPVLAAVSGHAIAMGAISLMACDVRVGIAEGAKVQLNETQIGLPLPYVALALGRRRLNVPHQMLAMVCAEAYDPAGAVAAGYLDATAPNAEFEAAILARAQALAKLEVKAFAETKRRLNASLLDEVRAASALDDAALSKMFGKA